MTKRQRLEELTGFVDLCIMSIGGDTLREAADKAQLSVTTMHRLVTHRFTLAVRWETIKKLGDAAKLRLHWTRSGQPRVRAVA